MQIKIANGFLEYEKLGKGIPLLFTHGYPLSRKIWKPQLDGLSDLALSISVDLRGHGDSFAFEGPYSMDTLASDCKRLLDDLTIKSPVVVCGLSMGGYISLAFYRAYPEIFKGMILTSTRSGPDSAEAKANRDASIKNALEFGAIYIGDNMLPRLFSPVTLSTNPDLVKTVHEIMVNTSIQGIVGSLEGMKNRLDSTPLLSQISCPVLIIHGADDQLIPQKEAELMDRQIPNSRLIKIAEAGHLPNLEQPDRFNKAVWDFLQSLG